MSNNLAGVEQRALDVLDMHKAKYPTVADTATSIGLQFRDK